VNKNNNNNNNNNNNSNNIKKEDSTSVSNESLKKLSKFSIHNTTNRPPSFHTKTLFEHQTDKKSQHQQDSVQKKESKNSKIVYTPLEKQVLELRKISHGALLFVECGYKYRFFGEDAEVSSICFVDLFLCFVVY